MIVTKKQILTISNGLSFLRLLLAFPIWFCLNRFDDDTFRIITVILCLIAVATDFLDGYFARRRNEITELGKIIDPLADKILVGLIAIKLFLMDAVSGSYLIIILLRDAIIFVGGIILSIRLKKVLPSNLLGKITVTIIAIVFLLIILGINKQNLIYIAIYYVSIVMIFASLLGYIIRAVEFFKKNKHNESLQQPA